MSPGAIRKRYIDVPHGQVHFRTAGDGPPVVLLHDSPRSSVMHEPQLEWLAEDFTVIALDTPGYGNSTPLPAEPAPGIEDFATALEATLSALGLGPCPVYGFHTSSKIALALGTRPGARVSGAILDGLSLPASPPDEAFIARYMKPFVVSDDAAHLAAQWTKVLDFHRFFPWFERRGATRLAMDLPDDRQLHRYCMDSLMAGASWTSAYAAAMRFPAREAIGRLAVPATFMCREGDVLYGYLDALPESLPAGSKVERLDDEPATWRERIAALVLRYTIDSAQRPVFPDPLLEPGRAEARGYVDLPHGQVHVRRFGGGDGRPLLMLHDAPGSSARLEPLARALATDRVVVVPDLPGVGESSALPEADMAGLSSVLIAIAGQLGWGEFDLYAEHLSARLAIDLAARAPGTCRRLVLDGSILPGARERRRLWREYCPRLQPVRDGSHLLQAWHLLRDMEFSWPWFERAATAARRADPSNSAAQLHAMTVDILKQPGNYGDVALAALEFPLRERLRDVTQPVLLLEVADDPRYADVDKIARRLPRAAARPRPATVAALAGVCKDWLDD